MDRGAGLSGLAIDVQVIECSLDIQLIQDIEGAIVQRY